MKRVAHRLGGRGLEVWAFMSQKESPGSDGRPPAGPSPHRHRVVFHQIRECSGSAASTAAASEGGYPCISLLPDPVDEEAACAVAAHAGNAGARSEPGPGSRFEISLPSSGGAFTGRR